MRLWTSIFLLCGSAVSSEFDKGKWKEVKIKQGPVRGYRDSSSELWTFRNIPYATAPTDKNKFKAPLPPPTWTEPLDADGKRIICPQFYWGDLSKDAITQENCLLANIYVPDTEKENLPVLVSVHGGAFQVGYADWVNLMNLMRYGDFILVNFNYRLGIHGFLCLGTADVPGNAGMKDQVALLRWVQENIGNFGGNPNDVTISGYSAGGSSVDLLMLSKAAEGLFHKVIPESGASLLAFTVQSDPLSIAKNHAKALNFTDVDNIQALEDFYKTLPYDTLTADAFLQNTDSTFTFSPCVENDYWDEAFLTKSPLTILKTGDYKKVPVLFGFANMEGDGQNFTVINEELISEEYKNMKKTIREIWHNFIITGTPVPKESSLPAWPAVGVGNSPYMSLGQKLELRKAIEPERFNFWQTIYQKYYKEPIPPPYSLSKTHTEL
ncbi:unnamed protein product [Arctia plantaginis]|uniref:Carboxylic ester hydrolase n=1 Tax=Arctia plantaginis TaxID=874455 RepID=A0A8S0ZDN0_ARCPL|nr:unnamed protein product [Arctia plantaginis]